MLHNKWVRSFFRLSVYLIAISIAGIMTMWVASDIFTGGPFIPLATLVQISTVLFVSLLVVGYLHVNVISPTAHSQQK